MRSAFHRRHPVGLGFVYLVGVVSSAVALLWWGLSTPEREERWWDITAVQAGRGHELSPARMDKLVNTLLETPALARQLSGDRRGVFLTAREGRYLAPGDTPLLLFDGGEPTIPIVAWFDLPGAEVSDIAVVTVHTGTQELTIRLEGTEPGHIVLPALETGIPVLWTVRVSFPENEKDEKPEPVRSWLQPREDRDE